LSNAEAAEPAIGEVQVDVRALPSLRADAAAVADQQHVDISSGSTDRRPAGAVERLQLSSDVAQLDEAVDGTQPVIGGDAGLQYC
jgi:hypothetical protein